MGNVNLLYPASYSTCCIQDHHCTQHLIPHPIEILENSFLPFTIVLIFRNCFSPTFLPRFDFQTFWLLSLINSSTQTLMVPSALASDVCSLLVLSLFSLASSWAFCSSLLSLDSERCRAASWAWNSFRSSTLTYNRHKYMSCTVLIIIKSEWMQMWSTCGLVCESVPWIYLGSFPGQQVLCGELVCSPHGLQLPLVILLSLGQLGLVLFHQSDLVLRELLHSFH